MSHMTERTLVEVGEDGVAVVSINNPPLNLLSTEGMLSLKGKLEEILLRDDVKAVVITGTNGKFSGGFDVTAFGGSQVKKTRKELGFFSIDFLTDTLEAARKPMVAAIQGMAFGGALEIALACHARISTSNAQLGLTELQYGILPGFGGTQRLPRLIGLSKSLEMILMSKRVNGEEARSLSLVDAIAPADKLLSVARQWALDIFERRKPWIISLYKTEKLEPFGEARAILKSARLRVQRETPNLNHPLVCIDVIEMGILSDPRNALWKEAEALQELRQSSTCRSLVHFFFAQRQISKIPGISEMNLQPRKINKVAVIGGGLMSSEIVIMLLLRNYFVLLKEKNHERLSDEIGKIRGILQHQVMNRKATPEMVEKAFNLLEGVVDYKRFKEVDLVIEAGSESLVSVQESFINLEKYCAPHCAFASNSSMFSLKMILERTKLQERSARMHFFCSFADMSLMEIVPTEATIPQVIVNLIDFGRKMRRTPIVIGDVYGYSVNNMIITYLRSAIFLASRNVDLYLIDEVLTRFGLQFGPFRMVDKIGFEIFIELCKLSYGDFPDVNYKSELISVLRQDNRQGEGNGKGFYNYDNSGKAIPDPEIFKSWEKTQNSTNEAVKIIKVPDGEITEMILFPAVNEACRIISEGVVIRSSDLDVASVLGMGFPSYRGGIIYWSDSIGSKHICTKLEKFSKEYGEFYEPCAYLKERASSGLPLAKSVKRVKSQL